MTHFPYLDVLVLLPAGASVAVAALPKSLAKVARALALAGSVATLIVAAAMAAAFHVGPGGFQMVSRHSWIRPFGISWYVGVDGISLLLVLLTALVFPVALGGAGERRNERSFLAWMLLLESACMGSFLSLDLFLFFVFFELTLVPTYFIIGGWGFSRAGAAAVKFFLYTFLGSAFLLIGILAVAFLHRRATGHLTFALPALAARPGFGAGTAELLFAAFTAAFAVKAPVFPFHTWSPDAYRESPTAGVVVLAAIMAKLGSYGIIRFDLELFPSASLRFAPVLIALAVIGILYGAVVAARQSDLKQMMAYSSLSHLGFIVLGIFALTTQGLSGGVLQMANHGLYTAALFLLIGMIYRRRRTWQADNLSGMQKSMPVMAAVFTVVMMASIGLPGLNGFVGEFLILTGAFLTHKWWASVATVGVVLAALYLLWAYQRAFHGPPGGGDGPLPDLSWRERAALAPLVLLIVGIGVYPAPLLNRITPSVDRLMAHVDASAHYRQPTVAREGARVLATASPAGARP